MLFKKIKNFNKNLQLIKIKINKIFNLMFHKNNNILIYQIVLLNQIKQIFLMIKKYKRKYKKKIKHKQVSKLDYKRRFQIYMRVKQINKVVYNNNKLISIRYFKQLSLSKIFLKKFLIKLLFKNPYLI